MFNFKIIEAVELEGYYQWFDRKGAFGHSIFPKTIAYCLLIFMLLGCNSESAPDCLQNSGDLVRVEVSVPDFTKITVFENVSLVVKHGDTRKVEIETGEFLLDEVTAEVEGERLLLRDTNDCNFYREYGLTTVYITSPNIDEIRSSTGWSVKSDGVLNYPTLTLLSESFVNDESETTDGEFDLDVDTETLSVVVNGIAYFKLRGDTQNLNLTIAAGDSRIEAENVIAQNATVNHRGSNDMFINPQLSVSGVIRGTGDVISSNRPVEVDVAELYKGKLIFK
ncbi:MAG: DUF2807 domain-containing protein [Pricia sp.]|nr:DUF2807 domain-containing protein [Pricia sp.]